MKERNVSVLGIILIFAGAFMLLEQFNLLGGDAFLYFVSACFFAAYFSRGGTRRYGNVGFLIPASIILMVAVFAQFEHSWLFGEVGDGMFFLLFAAVWGVVLIHTRSSRTPDWGRRNWPVFPGGFFLVFGVFVIATSNYRLYTMMHGDAIFGCVIIAFGFYLLAKGFRKPSRRHITIERQRSVNFGDDRQKDSE